MDRYYVSIVHVVDEVGDDGDVHVDVRTEGQWTTDEYDKLREVIKQAAASMQEVKNERL